VITCIKPPLDCHLGSCRGYHYRTFQTWRARICWLTPKSSGRESAVGTEGVGKSCFRPGSVARRRARHGTAGRRRTRTRWRVPVAGRCGARRLAHHHRTRRGPNYFSRVTSLRRARAAHGQRRGPCADWGFRGTVGHWHEFAGGRRRHVRGCREYRKNSSNQDRHGNNAREEPQLQPHPMSRIGGPAFMINKTFEQTSESILLEANTTVKDFRNCVDILLIYYMINNRYLVNI